MDCTVEKVSLDRSPWRVIGERVNDNVDRIFGPGILHLTVHVFQSLFVLCQETVVAEITVVKQDQIVLLLGVVFVEGQFVTFLCVAILALFYVELGPKSVLEIVEGYVAGFFGLRILVSLVFLGWLFCVVVILGFLDERERGGLYTCG